MQIKPIILAILFVVSGVFYYQFTDVTVSIETAHVLQIVDGDTVKLDNGQTLRLLGINTPEKSMSFSEEATEFLRELVQDKSVQVEAHGTEKYGRTLAYVFLDDKNINEEILAQGLGTLYYYEKDNYYSELEQAEEFARLNQKGLWKKSPDANCVELVEFKTDEPEKLILQNNCDKEIKIIFKDDATHIYKATLNPNSQFAKEFSHIWNDAGDSIYISDDKGLLIFYRY
ncbi:MAG: thermonuclease family protein [archaeon]